MTMSEPSIAKCRLCSDGLTFCSRVRLIPPFHPHPIATPQAALHCAGHMRTPNDGVPAAVRIGVHTGTVHTGLVGTRLPKFSVIGGATNAALGLVASCRPGARGGVAIGC